METASDASVNAGTVNGANTANPRPSQAHPGNCWGRWSRTASECAGCLLAGRCSETTKRLEDMVAKLEEVTR